MKESKILTCDNYTSSNRALEEGRAGSLMFWENPDMERVIDRYLAQGWEVGHMCRQGASLTILLIRNTDSAPTVIRVQESAETVCGTGALEDGLRRPEEEQISTSAF
jgi:hypothetical protein